MPRFLLVHDVGEKLAMSSSVAPLRTRCRTSCSRSEKRQVRIFPSAVKRRRLHWPQKGIETGAMMPNSPWPSANL